MPEWLLAPIDATRAHDVPALVAWHARIMTLAWGILVPCGILSARFLKLWPGQTWPERLDHPGWWHLHRALQYCAGVLTVAGLALALFRPSGAGATSSHALLGWSVISFCAVQFASAWLRGSKGGPTSPAADGSWRGDHYDMTRRRVLFEYLHKYGGYLAVLLAASAIVSGLWQANVPRWMWIAMGVWCLICMTAFVLLQRRGLTFDTYQA
ncbi:MAG: cytochrome b561 domain-containing protein, partial [Beijerinckiaceae bacterium]